MAVQEITSVPFVTPDTISDSASCFVESNGEFKRMTFEDLEILLTEGGALASYKKVKSDSENNNTLVLNDSKAVIGRLAGIEVIIPYKATGYNSITLEGSYATGSNLVGMFSVPLLIGISPSPGVFYGGTLSISADGTYTLIYRYDSEGEILDPSESVTATNVEALIHGIPHVPCTYECVSGSDKFEFYLSYYLSEYGRAADAKLTYDKINALTAQHTTDVTRIEAEIEEIVAPTGEAPSVAEVLDARVDVDGVTHNTLGGAIRAQINSVKDSIQDVEDGADAKILAEENARMAGDTQLQSDLDLEILSRQSLQGEVTTLQVDVSVLASELDTEESARESADSSLSDSITALDIAKFDAENVVNNLTTTDSGYALDARAGKSLNDKIGSLFKYKEYRFDYTNLQAGAFRMVTAGDFGMASPTGYVPFAVRQLTTGSNLVVVRSFTVVAGGNNLAVGLVNTGTSTAAGTVVYTIIYCRSDVISAVS